MNILKYAASLLATCTLASAATINVSPGFGGGSGIMTRTSTNSTLLPGGYYIAVGTFAVEPVISTRADLIAAVADFQVFAFDTAPASGARRGKLDANLTALDASFSNDVMYFLVGNGDTQASSSEVAIFRIADDDPGVTEPRNFPSDTSSAEGVGVTLSGVNVIRPLANAGSVLVTDASLPDVLILTPIPEASSAMLGLLGMFGYSLRRRR